MHRSIFFFTLFFIWAVALSTLLVTTTADAKTYPKVNISVLRMDITLQLVDVNGTMYIDTVFTSSDSGGGKGKGKGGYLSHGIAPLAMSGPMVACQFPSAAATSTICEDMIGDLYDADLRPRVTQIRSVSVSSAGLATVHVRTPTSFYKVDSSAGPQRWIFARGEWETEDGESKPGDHSGYDKGWQQASIDIFAGTVTYSDSSATIYIVLAVTWVVSVLLALVGGALKSVHQSSTRTFTWFCYIGASLIVLACFVVNIVIAALEFEKQGNYAPVARGFGVGATYLLSIILFPTTKYLNLGEMVAGISYDRQIAFHVLAGYLLSITVAVHFFWLVIKSAQLGSFGIIFNTEDEAQNTLSAFIGAILLLLFTLGGLLRSVECFGYFLFRVSHPLFLPILICFMVHFPPLAVACAPSLALYLADVLLRALRRGAKITAVEVDEESKIVKLVVSIPEDQRARFAQGNCHAGQYVIFSGIVPGFSGSFPHPFSFSHRARDGSALTFYIKAASISESGYTNQLFERAVNGPSMVGEVFQTFVGPVGEPEICLSVPSDVVLVAGGVGVTATLGLLYALAEGLEAAAPSSAQQLEEKMHSLAAAATVATGSQVMDATEKAIGGADDAAAVPVAGAPAHCCPNLKTISWIWVVREHSFVTMLLPHLVELSRRLRHIPFRAKIYLTGKNAHSVVPPEDRSLEFIIGRRPEEKDLEPLESRRDKTSTCYFSCGPQSMMDMVHAVAKKNGALEHAEVFTF